jgi:putative flippase GtrA
VIATLLYAALAWGFTFVARAPPVGASVAAYALAAIFSYFGHKRVTFRSDRPHGHEIPSFVASTGIGLLLATAAPLICTDRLHWPRMIAIALTCVAAPVTNFVLLEFLVFGRRAGRGTST